MENDYDAALREMKLAAEALPNDATWVCTPRQFLDVVGI